MLEPDDKKQTQIKKILAGIIGILFLFYVISCGDSESTPSPSTDATPPSAVSDLRVDSSTHDQVVLSWVAPTNAGTTDGTTAATISSYVVKYKTGDNDFTEIDETGEGVRLSGALTGTSTNATVTGLSASTIYAFLVMAKNSANITGAEPTPVEGTTTAVTRPENLRQVNTCAKTTSVDLTWDAVSGATSYKLYREDSTEIFDVTTNFYTDTDLSAGTSYTYTVRVCKGSSCSDDSNSLTTTTISDKSLKAIIDLGRIPTDLGSYDQRYQDIFSRYAGGSTLVFRYLKPNGTGDGSSPTNKAGNLKTVLEGITNASASKVYAVLLTGGNYQAESQMAMKNHVAIIGGVDECLDSSTTVTELDGEGFYRVFYNNNNSLNNTALLYGVTIINGNAGNGGGMYNISSSPSLVGVTFSRNSAYNGGGMYNSLSSPSLVGVTFSRNSADGGGGMYNFSSYPSLERVTFSENTAVNGGGMFNRNNSSPSLVGVTFSSNSAFSSGGGMYNDNDGGDGALIINGIFWGNTASSVGLQFYFHNNGTAQENLRIYNSIVEGGTGTLTNGTTYTNVNQGGFVSGGGMAPVVISFSNIITNDPGLVELADNGGSVLTHAIEINSPAVDQGLYVKKSGNTFYYSADKSTWYTEPDLSGTAITPPTDAVDLTATDATGYTRTGKPDLGAYEAR